MIRRYLLILILAMMCLVSCKTATEIEYVYIEPETIDIRPANDIMFATRPDNSTYRIITDIKTTFDIMDNGVTYAKAWDDWEAYAVKLEEYIQSVTEIFAGINRNDS